MDIGGGAGRSKIDVRTSLSPPAQRLEGSEESIEVSG